MEEAKTLNGTHSANGIGKGIDATNQLHKNFSCHEKIITGMIPPWYKKNYYESRISCVVLNSLLNLQDLQMKYINMYKDLVRKLYIYTDAIHILSTGYLKSNLIPPSQLNDMITQVKEAVAATNSEYDIVLKRLHLYYNMKLVTFGINDNLDLIIQFSVFVQLIASPH